MRNATKLSLALGCALAGATIAVAATPAQLIGARQQSYKNIGKANKAIMDELKKSNPSVPVIQVNATILNNLARKIPNWFPRGTGPEAGVKTAALPIIWQQPAEFKKAAANLAGATQALSAAASKGNIDAIRAAVPAVGNACKTCHQTYRAKE
jgi:cytochrome c556